MSSFLEKKQTLNPELAGPSVAVSSPVVSSIVPLIQSLFSNPPVVPLNITPPSVTPPEALSTQTPVNHVLNTTSEKTFKETFKENFKENFKRTFKDNIKETLAFYAAVVGVTLVLGAAGALAGFSLSPLFILAVVAAANISVATVSIGYAFFSRPTENATPSLPTPSLS